MGVPRKLKVNRIDVGGDLTHSETFRSCLPRQRKLGALKVRGNVPLHGNTFVGKNPEPPELIPWKRDYLEKRRARQKERKSTISQNPRDHGPIKGGVRWSSNRR